MIKQTDLRLDRLINIIGLITLIMICSCRTSKAPIETKYLPTDKDTLGEIIRLSLPLARESCPDSNIFSLCYGGFDIPSRPRLFIHLSTPDFMSSYDTVVYMYSPPRDDVLSFLKQNGLDYKQEWEMDSLFQNLLSESNEFEFYFRRYNRKVKKMIRQNELNVTYDGYLRYHTFKVEFDAIYAGNREISVPNINHPDKWISRRVLLPIFYIVEVYKAEPIPKETYLY